MLFRFHWVIAAVLIVLLALCIGLLLPGGKETVVQQQAWEISASPPPAQ